MIRPERNEALGSRPDLRLVPDEGPRSGPPHTDELSAARGILLSIAGGAVLWIALLGIVLLILR
jgi:hypothetical protein